MTARTHDAFAFASLLTVAYFHPPESINLMTLIGSVIASDVGSLVPDMDQAGNRLWDLLPAGDTVGKYLRKLFFEHRTFSHSIIGTLVIYKILQFLLFRLLNPAFIDPKLVLAGVMIGYLSHLLGDAFTKEGLPLFFPLKINVGIPPIEAFRIKTGNFIENFIIYPGIWIYVFVFIYTSQENLVSILKLVN
jgi:inner membrane protein